MDWARRNGYCKTNAFMDVQRPKANYRRSNYLTLDGSAALLAMLEESRRLYAFEGDVSKVSFCVAATMALTQGCAVGKSLPSDGSCAI